MQITTQSYKVHKETGKHVQSKGTNKSTKKWQKETEIYESFDKEYKITIIKILSKLKKKMHEKKVTINIENVKKNQIEQFGAEEYNNSIEKFSTGFQ